MNEDFLIYLQRALRALYFLATGLFIAIYFINIIEVNISKTENFYINFSGIIILTVSIILVILHKISIQLAYGLYGYTIILSGMVSIIVYRNDAQSMQLIVHESFYMVCAISLSVIAFNKKHLLIISSLFILFLFIVLISKLSIQSKDIPQCAISLCFYAIIVFSFIKFRNRYLRAKNIFNQSINDHTAAILSEKVQLVQQREEIATQIERMQLQNQVIEKKSKDLLDNLIFARSIQSSILPKEIEYQNFLPDSFILHVSKDEISGDFYWIKEKGGKLYIAAVDCTGHGVSGALVSMIGFLSLNRALAELHNPNPAEILNKLDSIFQAEFNHAFDDFNSKIGMDIALVSFDPETRKLEFSGAFNPLYIVRSGELIQIKANHYMLGIEVDEFFHHFENNIIEIFPGDSLYIFSDGFPDQFGGQQGKKFSYERLRKTLVDISVEKMAFQKTELKKIWETWKGTQEQTDDILVMGFRLLSLESSNYEFRI